MIVLRKNRYVKDDNLHRYHIRQGVAEDPGLMHRVKKVAFRTRLQSGMSHRVYNHHFFTRNNSCLDLKRQCRTKVDERESGMSPTVLPQFPSTCPTLMSCPRWYTRSAFPVPAASFSPFGTPETRLLYQWCAPVYSMHNKSLLTYIFCPTEQSETVLSSMKSYAHLKQHSFDN